MVYSLFPSYKSPKCHPLFVHWIVLQAFRHLLRLRECMLNFKQAFDFSGQSDLVVLYYFYHPVIDELL